MKRAIKKSKWQQPMLGPYIVHSMNKDSGEYKLRDLEGTVLSHRVTADRLIKVAENSPGLIGLDEYSIEHIVQHWLEDIEGIVTLWYEIKWEGYEENTYVAYDMMEHAQEAVRDYIERLYTKPGFKNSAEEKEYKDYLSHENMWLIPRTTEQILYDNIDELNRNRSFDYSREDWSARQ